MSLTEEGVPKWMVEGGDIVDGFMKEENIDEPSQNGFSVSPGMKPNTKGILFWDKPFIIRGKDGKEMCLLIMDTQGLWDYDTPNEFNVCIFGLSAVLSSLLIFNSKGFLNTEQLKNFSTLSEFSKGVASHVKAFQQLDFLIRDFTDYNSDSDDKMMANVYNREQMRNLRAKPQTKNEVKRIDSCFEHFDIFCLPKPGDIDSANYDGSIQKIHPLFMCILSDTIVRFVKDIEPRRINGEELTTKAFVQSCWIGEVTSRFALDCSELFNNQEDFPDSSSVLEAMYSSINRSVMKAVLEVGENGGFQVAIPFCLEECD